MGNKVRKALLLICISLGILSCKSKINENQPLLEKAIKVYEAGNIDQAKEMFLKLSKNGDFNADFELFYRYVNTPDQANKYLKNACINGHIEGMKNYLDRFLYRGNSLVYVNPKETLKIYKQYLKNTKAEEDTQLTEFLSKCAEVPELNAKKFCKKYGIDINDEKFNEEPYYIWQLAEEASRDDGRFGELNPELVLQLILRGGNVPAEFQSAVNDFYDFYKNNQVREFKIDDYVTSGFGINFCSRRNEDKMNQQIQDRIIQLADKFKKENQEKFLTAMNSYSEFVEEKIWSEEGNDGSGFVTWALNSKFEQNDNLLNLLEQANINSFDSSEKNIKELTSELDNLLKNRNELLEIDAIHGIHFTVTFEDEQKIDSLWNVYKNQIFDFADAQFDSQTAINIQKWIYSKRIEEIRNVIELYQIYQ